MQFKLISVAAYFGILAVANAQTTWSTSDIAPCALPCATAAAATAGCAITDVACLCDSDTFYTDLEACAPASCTVTTDVTSTVGGVAAACVSLNWIWKLGKCAAKCALKAAAAVGCAITDRACLCRNRAAFIAAFLKCIALNCPGQVLLGALSDTDANFIAAADGTDVDFVCPVDATTLPVTSVVATATAIAL